MNVPFEVVEHDSPEAMNHRARIKEQEGNESFVGAAIRVSLPQVGEGYMLRMLDKMLYSLKSAHANYLFISPIIHYPANDEYPEGCYQWEVYGMKNCAAPVTPHKWYPWAEDERNDPGVEFRVCPNCHTTERRAAEKAQ